MDGKENVDPNLDDFKPTKRGKRRSIKPSKRFKQTATNDEEVKVLNKGYIPDNTKKKHSMVFKGFQQMKVFEGGKLS